MFLKETPNKKISSKKDYKQKQNEHLSYENGTWNVRTLNQGGKLENLQQKIQKNTVYVLGVSEVWRQEQGKIRSGDYTVYVPEVEGLKKW